MGLTKEATAEFKSPVDPTVAKSMDELLARLQQKFRASPGSAPFANSFSLPMSGEKSLGCAEMRWTPSASHGGEVSRHLPCLAEESGLSLTCATIPQNARQLAALTPNQLMFASSRSSCRKSRPWTSDLADQDSHN